MPQAHPGKLMPSVLVASLLLAIPAVASAATLRVGPDEPIKRISDAARAARDGDTVLIMPGTYRGDVTTWEQKTLTIRGASERPVLFADGKSAEGKAIWVIRNGDFRVENVEFQGARVGDGNGAGIRFERGKLEVVNCAFADNQMGLLTANFIDAELTVRNSVFSRAPQVAGSLHHLLYVGRISRFYMEGSRLHGGYLGHLVKSRARSSELRYNLIFDGPGGRASYEVEFPNAGEAILVGNVVGQSAQSENPVVVAYGAEGSAWPVNRLILAHNTLISEGWRPAWFARAWTDQLPADTRIVTRNNLTVGIGAFTLALAGDHAGNLPFPPGALDTGSLDFTLGAGSFLRGFAAPLEGELAELMAPRAEFQLPVGTRALSAPEHWLPGAFQSDRPPSAAPTFISRLPSAAALPAGDGAGAAQPKRDE